MLDTIESKRSEATIPRRDDAKRQNPGREHDHWSLWPLDQNDLEPCDTLWQGTSSWVPLSISLSAENGEWFPSHSPNVHTCSYTVDGLSGPSKKSVLGKAYECVLSSLSNAILWLVADPEPEPGPVLLLSGSDLITPGDYFSGTVVFCTWLGGSPYYMYLLYSG